MTGATAQRFVEVEVEVLDLNSRTEMARLKSMRTGKITWIALDQIEDPEKLVKGERLVIRVETWVLAGAGWRVLQEGR